MNNNLPKPKDLDLSNDDMYLRMNPLMEGGMLSRCSERSSLDLEK
jgi:hypothetical protein